MVRRIKEHTVDGVVVERRYFSLKDELREETDARWAVLVAAAFPNGLPANIDEFETKIDRRRAVRVFMNQYANISGAEWSNIPEPLQKALAGIVMLVLDSIWYFREIPGMPVEDFEREDPVP